MCGPPAARPEICPPSQVEEFAIETSDHPGSYGFAVYQGVVIPLKCVLIKDTADGHVVYAVGKGRDEAAHLIKVVAGAVRGEFHISSYATPVACGAFDHTY